MLVRAFEIHHRVLPAISLALDAGEPWKLLRVFKHEGVGRSGIEPDVENIVDFLPGLVGEPAEKALARSRCVPGVSALFLERLDDTQIDLGIVEDCHRTVRLLLDEHRNWHAPGALTRDHPIRPALDHTVDAIFA